MKSEYYREVLYAVEQIPHILIKFDSAQILLKKILFLQMIYSKKIYLLLYLIAMQKKNRC